jgi:type I restriction enzyme, S subunit
MAVTQNITTKGFIINRSEIIGRIRKMFSFISKKYANKKLSDLALINPNTTFGKIKADDEITFVPMEAVDDKNGTISKFFRKQVSKSKGFTRFMQGDLIWAKITPCMQNGKSAVVNETLNGYACGSTEFYVIRPKDNNIKVEYLHFLLRDQRILDNAQNFFGGSAGQQRVSKDFLLNFLLPVPPISIQEKTVNAISIAQTQKQQKESQAKQLLESIDTYLLTELGIALHTKKSYANDRIFLSSYREIVGSRIDPKLYDNSTKEIKNAISNSNYPKMPLKDLIIQSAAGDWGIDEGETYLEGYTKCLVIRATEFDNNGNLSLDNSRVKYRMIKDEKLISIDVKEGDLLIEKSGGSPDQPVGRVAIITKEYMDNHRLGYSNFIHKIRLDESEVIPAYAFYFLKAVHNMKLTDAMQSQTNGIRNLIMSNYFNQNIVLPSITKQDEIVKHIKDIQKQITKLKSDANSILENAKAEVEKMILG